jgi:hypothetical protein
MNAFFIATSPLQLLCASEAYEYYGITDAELVIKYSDNQISNSMIDRMIEEYPLWKKVYRISKKRSFRDLKNTLSQVKKKQYDTVFNAEFNGWFQNVLLANILYSNRVIYDDGVMTINDYRVYFAPNKASIKRYIEKELILRLFGYTDFRPNKFEDLELFTMFDLEELPHVKVTRNNFAASASYRTNVKSHPEAPIGILGQPLVKCGIVSEKYYIEQLQNLTKTKKAYYFPHRGEDDRIVQKWQAFANIEVVREDTPIELAIAKHEISFVVGFISTALTTLSLLYPNLKIYFVRIPDQEFLTPEFCINAKNTYLQYNETELEEFRHQNK